MKKRITWWWRNCWGMIKEKIVIGPMGSFQSRFEADQNHWASSNLHDFFQRLLLWLERVAFPDVLACMQGISSMEKHVGSLECPESQNSKDCWLFIGVRACCWLALYVRTVVSIAVGIDYRHVPAKKMFNMATLLHAFFITSSTTLEEKERIKFRYFLALKYHIQDIWCITFA